MSNIPSEIVHEVPLKLAQNVLTPPLKKSQKCPKCPQNIQKVSLKVSENSP